MANGILQNFLGKNLSISITPQDVGADGTLSDNAIGTFTMSGRLDTSMFDEEASLAFDNITPGDIGGANAVPYELDATYTLSEIMLALPQVDSTHKGFGRGGVLRKCSKTSYWQKLVVVQYDNAGSPAAIETQTVYVVMTQPRSSNVNKAKSIDKSTLKLVQIYNTTTGVQQPNPAFT